MLLTSTVARAVPEAGRAELNDATYDAAEAAFCGLAMEYAALEDVDAESTAMAMAGGRLVGVHWMHDKSDEALKAAAAIRKLGARAVKLAVLDEAAAVAGTRPLEQVADFAAYGWGGSSWQLAADLRSTNVLGQYAGLLTVAQSHYHAREG